MLFNRQQQLEWIDIYCPVCSIRLGQKKKMELKSFKCPDCEATHYFIPGEHKRPHRSVPKSHKSSQRCNCGRCGR